MISYTFNSQMYAAGAELKWALNEGFYYVPDFAVRAAVNRVMGSRDIDLVVGSIDLTVSKTFGLFGVSKITPYLGYNMALVWAGSHVISATPTDLRDDPGSQGTLGLRLDEFVFSQEFIFNNRGFLGLIFNVSVATVAYEFMFAADSLYSHSFKLAFDF
jgi:hypothetical protein